MYDFQVTPCMGVWIETQRVNSTKHIYMSHPVWVCGLKHLCQMDNQRRNKSHPVWVCGLKLLSYGFALERVGHTLYGCVD